MIHRVIGVSFALAALFAVLTLTASAFGWKSITVVFASMLLVSAVVMLSGMVVYFWKEGL